MSPIDYRTIKLNRMEARKRIAQIVALWPERIYFTIHAEQELKNDGLTTADAINVLKTGASRITDEGELHRKGSYTYRLATGNITIVVAFEPTGEGLNVITGWDKRRGKKK
jgi:hypothetical protein